MASTVRTRPNHPKKPEPQSIIEKLLHWFFFGVIMALIPFVAAMFGDIDRNTQFGISTLFGQGELLIIATVISAGGIGDLFGTEVTKRRRTPKLIVLGLSIVSLVVTCLWFADISSLLVTKDPADPRTVAWGSIVLFIFAIIEGLSALLLAEG